MPGVPSSRGCDACRKVKKKCDQLKPKCSRCKRLNMTCIGSGQKRYMFKNQQIKTAQMQDEPIVQQTVVTYQHKETNSFGSPVQILSTNTETLAAAFVAALEVTDIRYGVAYYGEFLGEVPKRLGSSAVLDSAVKAVSTAYPFLRTGSVPPNALVHYGQSLRALRDSLNNPSEARAPHTLCALYLIVVCQSWLGKSDDSLTSHSEAISYLLKAARLHEWKGNFEMDMVITLCVPIILESVVNPRIKMDPQFWELVSSFTYRRNPDNYERLQSSAQLRHYAMFPEFIRNPDSHLFDIARIYLLLKNDIARLKPVLDQYANFTPVSFSSADVARHSKIQAGYSLISAMAVLLNSLLRVFDPFNPILTDETAHFCDEIITQAKLADCYRPVGSAYIPMCLIVAWVATDDIFQLAKIESVLADYQSDFAEVPWMSRAAWLGSTLNEHRVRIATGKQNSELAYGLSGRTIERKKQARYESCCIL